MIVGSKYPWVGLIYFHHFKTGEELIREFVLYTNGAPFNKSHIPRVFAVLLERIWRMINALPGVNFSRLLAQ
jgi:hypothetical protein